MGDGNGWSDIGYNFLVGEDGRAYEGRGWNRVGGHTYGYNSNSVAVSVIGDLPVEILTQSLKTLSGIYSLAEFRGDSFDQTMNCLDTEMPGVQSAQETHITGRFRVILTGAHAVFPDTAEKRRRPWLKTTMNRV